MSHAIAPQSPSTSRVPRDFYAELVRASQGAQTGFLADRERWLRSLPVEAREELLFEFEMLLRGLERYVHQHDHGVTDAQEQPLVTRDFREELKDVLDGLAAVGMRWQAEDAISARAAPRRRVTSRERAPAAGR